MKKTKAKIESKKKGLMPGMRRALKEIREDLLEPKTKTRKDDTTHLLSTSANKARLMDSIQQHKAASKTSRKRSPKA